MHQLINYLTIRGMGSRAGAFGGEYRFWLCLILMLMAITFIMIMMMICRSRLRDSRADAVDGGQVGTKLSDWI